MNESIDNRWQLASDKAEFITGENICIDGGMKRQMTILMLCVRSELKIA